MSLVPRYGPESFENGQTAELMNATINIKVDREERPDIDQIYMEAIHAMGEQAVGRSPFF